MSLFGTGRREGIVAACLVTLLAVLAHLAAGWFADEPGVAAFRTALAGGIGSALAYRFLRAHGRSRYAAFLGGAAYGLSPLLHGLADAPREQFAAATAPLALEACCQLARPSRRTYYLPWLGVYLALPFAFGATVVACTSALLGLGMLLRVLTHTRGGDHQLAPAAVFATLLTAGVATACLLELDPTANWLDASRPLAIAQALGGSVTPLSVTRTLGPLCIWFALFGVLRRQRHATLPIWLGLAALGTLPAIAFSLPALLPHLRLVPELAYAPAAGLWLCVLAITVLGAAGLDDWLEQPLRRRGAHLTLLLATLMLSPALSAFSATVDPVQQATVLGTFAVLAATTIFWRRLGVLRFKNVLAAMALLMCVAPIVFAPPLQAPTVAIAAPAPLGEAATPATKPGRVRPATASDVVAFGWTGLGCALFASLAWAFAGRRRTG